MSISLQTYLIKIVCTEKNECEICEVFLRVIMLFSAFAQISDKNKVPFAWTDFHLSCFFWLTYFRKDGDNTDLNKSGPQVLEP